MAKKKKKVTKKITPKPAPESTQMSEAIAEEIVSKHDSETEKVKPLVIKGNHLRQSEINNRVQLVMSFNPQIGRDQLGEWHCTVGYDAEKGITTIGVSALDAVLTMFDQLT